MPVTIIILSDYLNPTTSRLFILYTVLIFRSGSKKKFKSVFPKHLMTFNLNLRDCLTRIKVGNGHCCTYVHQLITLFKGWGRPPKKFNCIM